MRRAVMADRHALLIPNNAGWEANVKPEPADDCSGGGSPVKLGTGPEPTGTRSVFSAEAI
jgi:hypothetical protein